MTIVPNASDDSRRAQARATVQTCARIAGALVLLSMIAGGYGESYVPSRIIVSGDARATAENFRAFESMVRAGFAAYLVEALCDVSLALLFYVLLRAVSRDLALLSALLGLVGTAVFAAAEMFYFAPLHILAGADYLRSFSPDQLNAVSLLSLKVFGVGAGISLLFYGVATVVRGYLIFRSGYLPKVVGALLMLGGAAFIATTFLQVLAPAYRTGSLLVLMLPAGLLLTVWLLAKGVDVAKWEARQAGQAGAASAVAPLPITRFVAAPACATLSRSCPRTIWRQATWRALRWQPGV